MEVIKSILEGGLHPEALLPDINNIIGKVELLVKVAVLIGPAVLLILGLIYLVVPPREANHFLGYQFFWGKSSIPCWRFTQRVTGFIWTLLGLGMLVIMYFVTVSFGGKEAMEIISTSAKCILLELALIAISCIVVDVIVVAVYDRKGQKRSDKNKAEEE